MVRNAWIQPSPVDRFPYLEREAFGVGPGLAVDRRNLRRGTWAERNFLVPDTDDEDTIRCGDTRRVDDEGSGKLSFNRHALLQRAVGCGNPVVVSARFARFEAHLLRSAGLHNEGILLAAEPSVQAMDRGCHG